MDLTDFLLLVILAHLTLIQLHMLRLGKAADGIRVLMHADQTHNFGNLVDGT